MNNITFKLIDNVPHLYRWKTTSDVYKLGCTSWEDTKAPVEFYSHMLSMYKYNTQLQTPIAVSVCGHDFESIESLLASSDRILLAHNATADGIEAFFNEENRENPEVSIWDMGAPIYLNHIEIDWGNTSQLFDISVSKDGDNWTILGKYRHDKRFDSELQEAWGENTQVFDLSLPIEARYIRLTSYERYPCYLAPYTYISIKEMRMGVKTQTCELPDGADLWWYEDSVSEIHYDEELKNRYLIGTEIGAEIYEPNTLDQWGSKHYVLIPGKTTIEDIDVSEIAWIEGCTFDSEEAVFAAIEMGQEAYAQWLSENDTEVAILEHQLDLETRMICQELGVAL